MRDGNVLAKKGPRFGLSATGPKLAPRSFKLDGVPVRITLEETRRLPPLVLGDLNSDDDNSDDDDDDQDCSKIISFLTLSRAHPAVVNIRTQVYVPTVPKQIHFFLLAARAFFVASSSCSLPLPIFVTVSSPFCSMSMTAGSCSITAASMSWNSCASSSGWLRGGLGRRVGRIVIDPGGWRSSTGNPEN